MNHYVGKILEFRLLPDGQKAVLVECANKVVPSAGQFSLAFDPSDDEALLPVPLFFVQQDRRGFIATTQTGALPANWRMNSSLILRGPFGKGFALPRITRNLAIAAVGSTISRLLPLFEQADNTALFTDLAVRDLPAQIEIQPFASIPEAFGWADFVVCELPFDALDDLPKLFNTAIPPGQVLINAPIPCGGIGDCGVCAVRNRKGYQLSCKNGPVFPLNLFL